MFWLPITEQRERIMRGEGFTATPEYSAPGVYFLLLPTGGIKIGAAQWLKSRLNDQRRTSTQLLGVIRTSTRTEAFKLESELHQRFAADHCGYRRGTKFAHEVFTDSPALRDFIVRNRTDAPQSNAIVDTLLITGQL